MIALVILIALCYYGAYAYQKKRNFYRTHSREVIGEVVFFEKRHGWKGQRGWRYYLLKVVADGKDYLIETDNSKARKYQKNPQITLLVPEELENPLSDSNLARVSAMANTPEERAEVERLYAKQQDVAHEIDSVNTRMRSNLAIIKEDLPSAGAVWFLAIFGTLLLGGTVAGLVIDFLR